MKFAELDRSKELQYGVNLFGLPGQSLVGSSTGQFGNNPTIVPAQTGQPATYTIAQALNLFAFDPKLNLGAFIKALEAETILQILAEPNLVTTNGKEAIFLVGGQFPVPILQGGANAGAVTVQFRNSASGCGSPPLITRQQHASKCTCEQEVSTLDTADGVSFNGFNIPALSTRRTETDVELGDGPELRRGRPARATRKPSLSKMPISSSIPILGQLFKQGRKQTAHGTGDDRDAGDHRAAGSQRSAGRRSYFPKDFLVRLTPADVQQAKGKTAKKSN